MNLDQLAAEYRTLALEGSDGVGKTALAHQLATGHGFTIHHCTRPPAESASSPVTFDAIVKALPGRIIRLDAADPHFAPG